MRISQDQLNLLSTCPRQFQYQYLDQLGALPLPEQQQQLLWGSQFHRLVQQAELGLPIQSLVQSDFRLQACFQAWVEQVLQTLPQTVWRQSEHPRTLEFGENSLVVIYDMLVLEDDRAQILDWKTYARPRNPQLLAQNWQTRLYLYVLAETSDYQPEQLSMTYWFLPPPSQPGQSVTPTPLTFPYSESHHTQTHQDLTRLLQQLQQWLQSYSQDFPVCPESGFPQVEQALGHCQHCSFTSRCQRLEGVGEEQAIRLPSLAEIPEIPI